MPTLLEALNVPIPEHVQGRSLLPLMRGDVASLRPFAVSGWYGANRSIRDDRWSFHKCLGQNLNREAALELYDLKNDPGETENLFTQHPDVAEKLDRQLEAHILALKNS